MSPIPSHVPSQALLKLNRKLQPMVDGIEANRKKWQDLHLSYQQTRRASLPSQCADPNQSPESQENAKATQHLGSAETLKQGQDAKCSPEAEWIRLPVWPVPDDDTSLIHRSTAGRLSRTVYLLNGLGHCVPCATLTRSIKMKSAVHITSLKSHYTKLRSPKRFLLV